MGSVPALVAMDGASNDGSGISLAGGVPSFRSGGVGEREQIGEETLRTDVLAQQASRVGAPTHRVVSPLA